MLVANNQFYAMGGWNDSGVERATVNADGSLGLWQRENFMTTLRGELAGAAYNGFLYALGGTYGDSGRTTEFAHINADGTVGTWQQSTSMIETRAYFAAIAHNGFLYAIGGDKHSPATVERAPIHADGSLGTWEPYGTMNYARKSRNAVVIGNFLYVFGDSPSAGQADTIERAALSADGTIGNWQVIGTLPVSRSNPAVVATHAFVYIIGGHVELTDYQSVIQLPILADGTLGAVRFLQDLHRERQAPTALIYKDHLYVAGGADYPNGSDESVEWAALSNLGAPRNNGVTINNGALFTNATAVTLSITGQTGVIEMALSNDGGFAGAVWEPCRATKAWTITSFGNSILPRTVYVRYRDDQGAVSSVVQDDIILDVTAPSGSVDIVPLTGVLQRKSEQTVQRARPVPVQQTTNFVNLLYLPLIATSRSNCPQTGAPTVILRLNAQDDVSGVQDMLISNTTSFTCADWQPFAASQAWYVPSGATTTVYVKFRDNAGNISADVQDTVTLPVK